MELKDFIKETILEISTAIKEANEEAEKNGLNIMVNPDGIYGGSAHERSYTVQRDEMNTTRIIEEIKFDVAVTTEAEKTGNVKGGIKIASFDIGGGGSLADKNSTISRITFSIPVSLPTSKWKSPSWYKVD